MMENKHEAIWLHNSQRWICLHEPRLKGKYNKFWIKIEDIHQVRDHEILVMISNSYWDVMEVKETAEEIMNLIVGTPDD